MLSMVVVHNFVLQRMGSLCVRVGQVTLSYKATAVSSSMPVVNLLTFILAPTADASWSSQYVTRLMIVATALTSWR